MMMTLQATRTATMKLVTTRGRGRSVSFEGLKKIVGTTSNHNLKNTQQRSLSMVSLLHHHRPGHYYHQHQSKRALSSFTPSHFPEFISYHENHKCYDAKKDISNNSRNYFLRSSSTTTTNQQNQQRQFQLFDPLQYPSSATLLKQDDDDLSAEEIQLKQCVKSYHEYIIQHKETLLQKIQEEKEQEQVLKKDDENEDDDMFVSTLEDLFQSYMGLGYWEEALALEQTKCKLYFVENTYEYADSIHIQGKLYLRMEQFSTSKELYDEALEYFTSKVGADGSDGDNNKQIIIGTDMKTMMVQQKGHVLISLAGWYYFQNQLSTSLELLHEAEPLLDSNPSLLYKCLDNQGLIYRLQENFEMALDMYQQALQVVSNDNGNSQTDSVNREHRRAVQLHIGDMLSALDEPLEALQAYEELLFDIVSTDDTNGGGGGDSGNVGLQGVLLHNIATIHVDQGHYDDALEQFQRALSAKQLAGGEYNSEVAKTWNAMGALYGGAFGDKRQAIECFRQALTIARVYAANDSTDPDVQSALHNISFMEQELAKEKK